MGGLAALAALAYLAAIFHRMSLSVAGLRAAERFDIGAALLSALPMLTMLVYAAGQVPAACWPTGSARAGCSRAGPAASPPGNCSSR